MTTVKVRKLLNNLVGFLPQEESYLEIGIHQGGTLIPALAGHKTAEAIACDNWTQFENTQYGSAKAIFHQNIAKHQGRLPAIRVVDLDIWKFLAAPEFKKPLGLVFYDGDHTEDSQRKIWTAIQPYLGENAIMIIDDYDHPPTKSGSELGLKDTKWKETDFVYQSGPSGFHNGLGIFFLSK
jgi:hypothetical protein